MKKKSYINIDKLPSYVMPMKLDACLSYEYAPALEMLFHDERFEKLVEHRNKIFNVAERPGANAFAIQKGLQQDDARIAMMILTAMQRQTLQRVEPENININDLWKQIPKDDTKKQKIKESCSYHLDMVNFLADIIESKLTDIQQELNELFPNEGYGFEQFNGVTAALHQLSSAFGHTRTGNSEQQALFGDYADSIENYFNKRMKTFSEKYAKLSKKKDAVKTKKQKK